MKLRKSVTLAGLGLAAAALLSTLDGCGGSKEASGATSRAGKPPARPGGGAKADRSTRTTFALRKLWMGETTREGQRSNDAWKKFGYDLDGKMTKAGATDVCKPKGGAVVTDGDNGVDNAFGAVLLGALKSFLSDPSATPPRRSRTAASRS